MGLLHGHGSGGDLGGISASTSALKSSIRRFVITEKAPTSVLNVKALVGAFNQEKALVGAFSVIVQPVAKPMDRFAALYVNHASFVTFT